MDGCRVFEVFVDGKQEKRFSWETVNSYFINNGYTKNKHPFGRAEYWAEFWFLLEKYPITEREEYTDGEFCEALEQYRNQDIGKSVSSPDPLVRMFAVLDRRVGKRSLRKIKEVVEEQPLWLKRFYQLRFDAEGL